jgi:hypothetical protein
MFSAFDRVMLRKLPVRDPEQLVRLVQKFPQAGTRSELPYAVYDALNRHSRTLTVIFGETQMNVPLTDPGPAAIVRVGLTTPEFFEELLFRPCTDALSHARMRAKILVRCRPFLATRFGLGSLPLTQRQSAGQSHWAADHLWL